MGCCCGKDYERLSNEISLVDNLMPIIPEEVTKLRDCSKPQARQLAKLFELFDSNESKTITSEELKVGLITLGKTPSKKSLTRMIKQMHLSSAPNNEIEFKGFSMAIISRRSLLYDFLYSRFDTIDEAEAEIEEEKQKGKGFLGSIFSKKK